MQSVSVETSPPGKWCRGAVVSQCGGIAPARRRSLRQQQQDGLDHDHRLDHAQQPPRHLRDAEPPGPLRAGSGGTWYIGGKYSSYWKGLAPHVRTIRPGDQLSLTGRPCAVFLRERRNPNAVLGRKQGGARLAGSKRFHGRVQARRLRLLRPFAVEVTVSEQPPPRPRACGRRLQPRRRAPARPRTA
jgi:hypothetical protein